MRDPSSSVPLRLLLTMEEAAEAMCLSRSNLYVLVMQGTISSVKVGRRRLVPIAALERFIAQQITAQEVR